MQGIVLLLKYPAVGVFQVFDKITFSHLPVIDENAAPHDVEEHIGKMPVGCRQFCRPLQAVGAAYSSGQVFRAKGNIRFQLAFDICAGAQQFPQGRYALWPLVEFGYQIPML